MSNLSQEIREYMDQKISRVSPENTAKDSVRDRLTTLLGEARRATDPETEERLRGEFGAIIEEVKKEAKKIAAMKQIAPLAFAVGEEVLTTNGPGTVSGHGKGVVLVQLVSGDIGTFTHRTLKRMSELTENEKKISERKASFMMRMKEHIADEEHVRRFLRDRFHSEALTKHFLAADDYLRKNCDPAVNWKKKLIKGAGLELLAFPAMQREAKNTFKRAVDAVGTGTVTPAESEQGIADALWKRITDQVKDRLFREHRDRQERMGRRK